MGSDLKPRSNYGGYNHNGNNHNNNNNNHDNNNNRSYASPRDVRSHHNPYANSGGGLSKTVQYVVACLFITVLCGTINVTRLSGNIGNAVKTEVDETKHSVENAVNRIEKINSALRKTDDDKMVKVPKELYHKLVEKKPVEVDAYETLRKKEEEEETAAKHKNMPLKKKLDEDYETEEKNMPPGHRYRENKNTKLTAEEENLMYLEDKILNRKLPNPDEYDYHAVHHDEFYHHLGKAATAEDEHYNRWVDAPKDHADYRTHINGKKEEVHDAKDVDPNNPLEIPPRKHRYDNRWEQSENLPGWMKDYFYWHSEARAALQSNNYTNWNDYNYLIISCFSGQVCGNVIHRIRPLPALVRAARDSKRILLVHWDLHPIQDYLEPPNKGGLNWKIPGIMSKAVHDTATNVYKTLETVAEAGKDTKVPIVSALINDRLFGEPYYNGHIEHRDLTADRAFHDVFNVFFKPTAMLTERVHEVHHTMGMPVGKYAAVHVDYPDVPTTEAGKEALRLKVENALNCVSNLRPGGPFLVAGESFPIVKEAIKYAKKHNVMVAARQVAPDSSRLQKDMWNSFIEIYFMANARCVAYANDGYGQLGYMMGYEHDCRIKYDYHDAAKTCTWTDTQEQADELKKLEQEEREKEGDPTTLVFKPEDAEEELWKGEGDGKDEIDDTAIFKGGFADETKEIGMPIWLDEWVTNHDGPIVKDGPWFASNTMPKWMKMYLTWHKEAKANITESNWKDQRYLIMTCYNGQACGNVNSRLRPLPAHIRIAANTKRILLIHWDKPNRLEYFVETPKETKDFGDEGRSIGMDWTVPDYMVWKVRASSQQTATKVLQKQALQLTRTVVNSNFNDDTFMEDYYNARLVTDNAKSDDNDKPADQVYRDLFLSMFEPSLALQERVDEVMDHVGITTGNYSVAHVDYPIIPSNDDEEKMMILKTEAALNCLTQVNPDGPYVAFTETLPAAGVATAYGLEHGLRIPAKQITHDKHVVPKDVMGSFAEIYLMVNAKCVSYGRSSFGALGYILGQDYNCKIKYAGPDAQECAWKGPKLVATA